MVEGRRFHSNDTGREIRKGRNSRHVVRREAGSIQLVSLSADDKKRPNALKYVAFYDQLPVQWKEFFERSDRDGKKAGLKLLSKMLSESDMATATRALIESDSRDMKVKVWTNSIIYIPVIWFFVRLEQLSQ